MATQHTKESADEIAQRWNKIVPGGDIEAKRLSLKLVLIGLAINHEHESWSREKFDLTRGELAVLMSVRRAPLEKMRPTDLFVSLSMSSAGVTKQLNMLAARGLIRREPNPAHKGGFLVTLTDAGRQVADEAHGCVDHLGPMAEALARLSPKDRKSVESIFDTLLQASRQGAEARKSRSVRSASKS